MTDNTKVCYLCEATMTEQSLVHASYRQDTSEVLYSHYDHRECVTNLRHKLEFARNIINVLGVELTNVQRDSLLQPALVDWVQDVKNFHAKCHVPIGEQPRFADVNLRRVLITEEFRELMKAIDDEDIVETADALADLIYVLIGSAITWGIPLDKVWAEVQRTNMMKEPENKDGFGKV